MDGEQVNFVSTDHVVNAIPLEPTQTKTADIREPDGIQQRVCGQRGDSRLDLIKEIIPESRLLLVVSRGSGKFVLLN
jgi:hypothetical protein